MLDPPLLPVDGVPWPEAVLAFWFDELKPRDRFRGNAALDATIRNRFGALISAIGAAPRDQLASGPERALAAVIVCDQFPRNAWRGRAEAFALDARAVEIADVAIESGWDQSFCATRRRFLYMPFMHAEAPALQARALALFGALAEEAGQAQAVEHHAIIARFGRFPHRNAALGRVSTPEEIAFLQTGPTYGQLISGGDPP